MTGMIQTKPHMTLHRVGALSVETRAYLEFVLRGEDVECEAAFRSKLFGFKSEYRYKLILWAFKQRFQDYPAIIDIYKKVNPQMVFHNIKGIILLHMMLSDPIFRWFAGTFLLKRYREKAPFLFKLDVSTELDKRFRPGWKTNTLDSYVRQMITATRELGLLNQKNEFLFDRMEPGAPFLYLVFSALRSEGFSVAEALESDFLQVYGVDLTRWKAWITSGDGVYWQAAWRGSELFLDLRSPEELS